MNTSTQQREELNKFKKDDLVELIISLRRNRDRDEERYRNGNIFLRLFERLEHTGRHKGDVWAEHERRGHYTFIPFPPNEFISRVQYAATLFKEGAGGKPPQSFIDIGCGIATKVALAAQVLEIYQAHGLEYSKDLCKQAKDIWGEEFAKHVIQGDALTFKEYEKYDILYMYRPLSDGRKQAALEERVILNSKPGSVIIFGGCGIYLRDYDHYGHRSDLGHVMLTPAKDVAPYGPNWEVRRRTNVTKEQYLSLHPQSAETAAVA